jgi:AcrR family transcriptional regulator
MSETQDKPEGTAAERIMNVASELFYKQGYRATGINEVIKKSGVAKATFYSHFPTKDDLCKVYLKGLSESELAYIDGYMSAAKGVENRFYSIIQSLEAWLIDTEFRGCGFINMASEIPDFNSPLRKPGKKLYSNIRLRVEKVCQELIDSDADKYGHLDMKVLSSDYMVAFAGAVALAELYHDIWPVEHAVKTVRGLIGEGL